MTEHPTPADRASCTLTETELGRVREAFAAALSPNTWRTYLGHWEAFQRWSKRHGRPVAPTDPDTVSAHLADSAKSARPSTLRVRSCAIKAVHQAAGLADPTAAESVRKGLAGLVCEAVAAGLGDNFNGFNGQSPRVGMAQDFIATRAELHRLMSVGNWKTSAMPMQYARNQAKLGAVARYYTK